MSTGHFAGLTLFSLVTLVLPCPGWTDARPQAGLYEMTVSVTGGGFLGDKGQQRTSRDCISADEFAKGPDAFAEQGQQQECQMNNYSISDGQISLELSCSMAEAIEASVVGSGSYRNDSFELTNHMTMKSHGLELKMESQVVGKRIGDC